MPAWNAYKEEAKARGALALELYVVQSTPQMGPEKLKATLPYHLAYQAKMETEGKLMFAGPMSDETGELMQGVGMSIYRASSMEEAKDIADNDPMHKNGVRSYSLRKWMINEGSLTVKVGLSAQTVALD